jgi:hypothetical protein
MRSHELQNYKITVLVMIISNVTLGTNIVENEALGSRVRSPSESPERR